VHRRAHHHRRGGAPGRGGRAGRRPDPRPVHLREAHLPGVELPEVGREAHREAGLMPLSREQIAARAAKELKDGMYVNLGIGLPTLAANYLPPGVAVIFQSETGMLGIGPYPTEAEIDPDLVNAGKGT